MVMPSVNIDVFTGPNVVNTASCSYKTAQKESFSVGRLVFVGMSIVVTKGLRTVRIISY